MKAHRRRTVAWSTLVALAAAFATVISPIAARPAAAHVGTTTRGSVASGGAQADSVSDFGSLSADGRYLAFQSDASNLIAGDTNTVTDVFVRDRISGTTERVSVSTAEVQADRQSRDATISADGRFVAFQSDATTLSDLDADATSDIFVRDRQLGTTILITHTTIGGPANSSSFDPVVSADGTHVAFQTSATNLFTGDTNSRDDVLVSHIDGSVHVGAERHIPVAIDTMGALSTGHSAQPSISADGRYVAFDTPAGLANGLDVVADSNGNIDVYVRDVTSQTTTLVSATPLGLAASGGGRFPSISSDGRFIAYNSDSGDIDPADADPTGDVFVRDMTGLTSTVVSLTTEGNHNIVHNLYPKISADGRFVAFVSFGSMVPGDSNNVLDIYVRDRLIGNTVRASVATSVLQGNQQSMNPSISSDGRFVSFSTDASNLVPADTNGVRDVLVHERPLFNTLTAPSIVRASETDSGNAGFQTGQQDSDISGDGRYAAFVSTASNFDAPPAGGQTDVYVKNLLNGKIRRVSISTAGVTSNGSSNLPVLSHTGRFVAFESDGSNLVPSDGNSASDVFLHDRDTDGNGIFDEPGSFSTERVSVPDAGGEANGFSSEPSISENGRVIAFTSMATNIVAAPVDDNLASDVFVRDLTAVPSTILISKVGPVLTIGNGPSYQAAISGDGEHVAFATDSTNLAPGDANGTADVLVVSLISPLAPVRVSKATVGKQGNGYALHPAISADGKLVAFESVADNLVPEDNTGHSDVFLHNRDTDSDAVLDEAGFFETTRESLGIFGAELAGQSSRPDISADGRHIAFLTGANFVTGTGDNDASFDTYVRARDLDADGIVEGALDATTIQASLSDLNIDRFGTTYEPSISADGRRVAFSTNSTLVQSDTNGFIETYVRDIATTPTDLISRGADGRAGNNASGSSVGRGTTITPDGRHVLFASNATNLAVPAPGPSNGSQLYVVDRFTSDPEIVSTSTEGTLSQAVSGGGISEDGRYVAFSDSSPLTVDDSNLADDVFLRDRASRTTRLISRDPEGLQITQSVDFESMAGNYVLMVSQGDLGAGPTDTFDADLFVHNIATGQTSAAFRNATNDHGLNEGVTIRGSISADGNFIAIETDATDYDATDTNALRDVYLLNRSANTATRISRPAGGLANGSSVRPKISSDGTTVVFSSVASNLVAGDTNGERDIFAYHRPSATLRRVSLTAAGAELNDLSDDPTVSETGRFIGFRSHANGIVSNDNDSSGDGFIRDRLGNTTRRASVDWSGKGSNVGLTRSFSPSVSSDGLVAAFASEAYKLTPNDSNGMLSDVYTTQIAPWPVPIVADVTGLSITADTASIGAGAAAIPLSSIPIESIPILSDQMGQAELGNVNMESSPISSIPISSIGLEAATFDPAALDNILISSIPIDWDRILQGSTLEGLNVNSISIKRVLDDTVARPRFLTAAESIPLEDFGVDRNLLAGTSIVSALMGSTPISSIPPPGPAGTTWCALLTANGFDCSGLNESSTTLLGLDIAGAPISSIPISSIPISSIPLVGPISSIPISSIPLVGPISSIPISSIGAPNNVVDCSRISCAAADGKTLRQAAQMTPSAIRSGATLRDLQGAFGDITLGQIIVELLARSDFPWETVPVNGLAGAGNSGTVGYNVGYTFTCTDPLALATKVNAPPGFVYVNGSTRFSYNGSSSVAGPDPVRSGNTLTFNGLPGNPCQPIPNSDSVVSSLTVATTFRMRPSFTLGTYSAAVEVTMNGVPFAASGAAVNVVEQNEPNDTAATAADAPVDHLIVGHISSNGDEDIYKLTLPPGRSRMFMSLSGIAPGQDFDLITYAPQQDPLQSSPISSIPISSIPIEDDGADFHGTNDAAPEGLADIPISSIPLLGPISSISTNRDNADEKAEFISSGAGGTVYLRVTGFNGSNSDTPYVLRAWTYGPPPLPPSPARVVPGDADPHNGPDEATTRGTLPTTVASDRQTIFLVNQDRLSNLYGADAANDVLTNVNLVAQRPEVRGVVLPIEADPDVRAAFAAWDANPNSTIASNGVVREVNTMIATYRATLPSLRYIVVVGSDELIPFARVIDGTTLSNEIDEAGDLAFTTDNLTKSNATYGSAAQGQVLTDAPYGTFTRIPWLGRELFLPDISVSRLVETPAQISAQLRRYVSANGVLNPQTALITGYDFLTDGAEETAGQFEARFGNLNTRRLIDDTWTREQLIAEFTGRNPAPDIAAVNAHYSHNLAQPAGATNRAGLFSTADVPDPPAGPLATPPFALRVLFTVGCHGGLNVPDTAPSRPSDPVQLRDWAQSWAGQQAAVYIGNTGFGYGDTTISALSERLFSAFARNLRDDSLTMGEKWVQALHAYFRSAGTYGVYDEKVLIEATMYGLPFYRIGGTNTAPPPLPAPVTTVDPITGLQQATIVSAPTLTRTDTARGSFWRGPDGTHDKHFRPVQPVVVTPVTVPGVTAKGFRWVAATSADVPSVNPFLSRPSIDQASHEAEIGSTEEIYPAQAVHLTRSRAFGKEDASLVFIAGQYRPTVPAGDTGVQRLFTSATFEVAYSNSSDNVAPTIHELHVVGASASTAKIIMRTTDDNAAGVKRVSALYRVGTSARWQYVDLTRDGDLWAATINVPGGGDGAVEVLGQSQDAAGMVGFSTDKGYLHRAETDVTLPKIVIRTPTPNQNVSRGARLIADFSCSDDTSGVVSCTGTTADGAALDTSTLGMKSLTVTARDGIGNVVTKTVKYIVVNGPPPLVPDTLPPVTQFLAGDDIVISVSGVRVDTIGGRTTDNFSGVDAVTVTYVPLIGGAAFTTKPTLSCDASRRTCGWRAQPPPVPGRYEIRASAKDKAGNQESPGPKRTILVI